MRPSDSGQEREREWGGECERERETGRTAKEWESQQHQEGKGKQRQEKREESVTSRMNCPPMATGWEEKALGCHVSKGRRESIAEPCHYLTTETA
jgi:hypothetical protein